MTSKAEDDMTDADRIAHFRKALERIAEPQAFYIATSNIDPEAYARMIYAKAILDGYTLEAANAKTEYETRERYPLHPTPSVNPKGGE